MAVSAEDYVSQLNDLKQADKDVLGVTYNVRSAGGGMYTARCAVRLRNLADVVVEGAGRGKAAAKHNAAQKALEVLKESGGDTSDSDLESAPSPVVMARRPRSKKGQTTRVVAPFVRPPVDWRRLALPAGAPKVLLPPVEGAQVTASGVVRIPAAMFLQHFTPLTEDGRDMVEELGRLALGK